MSETTITCKGCGERVPKKRFCGECGASLAIINQPTSKQDKISTPVQVADSVSLDVEANKSAGGQTTDAVNKPPTPPTITPSRTDDPRGSGGTSSYAEAARSSNLSHEEKRNAQQNNQGGLSNNRPTENLNMTVHMSRNDGTAARVDNGTSKATEKVQ